MLKKILLIFLLSKVCYALPKWLEVSTVLLGSAYGAHKFPEVRGAFIAGGLTYSLSRIYIKKPNKSLNKYLWGTYLTGEIIDVIQTHYILEHKDRYYEVNPLIHKTSDLVISSVVTTSIIYVMTKIFPRRSTSLLLGANAFKYGLILHNKSIGLWFGTLF